MLIIMSASGTERLTRTILADKDETAHFTFQQRDTELSGVLANLELCEDFSHLRPIDISYRTLYSHAARLYPKQAVAILPIFMPTWGHIGMGIIDPKSKLVVVRRHPDSTWAPNTWSFPMGHLEDEDTKNNPQIVLSDVIHNGASRERDEEILIRQTGGFSLITGSFVDKKTGYLVHVVAQQLGGDNWEYPVNTMTIGIGDPLEHTDIGWADLDQIHKLSQMEGGSKFVLHTALTFMQNELRRNLQTGRYT